jgi:adenylate cyclase
MPRLTLRRKLLFFSIALAMLPLGVAGRSMIRITQDELKSSANDELITTARQLAGDITRRYRDTWLAPLLLIRNSIDNERLGVEEKVSLVTSGMTDIPDIAALQVTARGIETPVLSAKDVVTTRLKAAGLDGASVLRLPADRLAPFFGGEPANVFVGDLTYVPQTDDWFVSVILPLRNPLAGRPAVFSARIDLGRLREFIASHPFNSTGELTLVDAEGRRIFDAERRDLSGFAIVASALGVMQSRAPLISVQPFQRPTGETMLGAFSFPEPFSWAIIAEKNEADAYLAISMMVRSLLLWLAIGLTVAILGAIAFSLGISRPILKIGHVADAVSQGNLSVRVEGVRSRDEIGDLAERMNRMIEGLLEKLHLEKFVSGETLSAVKGSKEGVKLGGERKLVTVFFSDIRGFTAFSETREPEEVVEMLNTFLGEQARIVSGYKGDIDKFVGDELVAVFQGEAMVDRAVRCAVDIQQRMAQLGGGHPDWGISIGIGINAGEVVMGAMGSESRMDYTILGDHVNLGARLCSSAGRGEILVSEHAHRWIANPGAFDMQGREPIRVKGKAEPIRIYGVTGYAGRAAGEPVTASSVPPPRTSPDDGLRPQGRASGG